MPTALTPTTEQQSDGATEGALLSAAVESTTTSENVTGSAERYSLIRNSCTTEDGESDGHSNCMNSSMSSSDTSSAKASIRKSLEGLHIGGDCVRRRFVADLNPDDIICLSELGRGNGGIVSKAQHKPTGLLMAKKTFDLDIKTSVRAQILRDLQILCECSSPLIVEYYAAFHQDATISMCMEYMDAGGLDTLLPMVGRFPEPIIIQIADAVIKGLIYLWQELHTSHRNLKPSNVLVNRAGVVKLSDFVVSPQLVEAFANGFVGLRTYMAPERTVGEQPGRSSDIWSLGLVLMELAIGHYPIPAIDPVDFVRAFAPDRESNMVEHWRAARTGEHLTALEGDTSGPNSLFELLVCVVEHPAPRLPAYCFSADFIHMIHSCLQKEPHDRLSIELLHSRIIPDLLKSTEEPVDNCVQPKCLDVPSSCPDSISVSPSPVTIVDYLNGVFARQQAEAIDAVALVVGDDMDAVDESMTSSGVGKNWDPLSATVTRPSDSD